jgi:hypothetical protein
MSNICLIEMALVVERSRASPLDDQPTFAKPSRKTFAKAFCEQFDEVLDAAWWAVAK